MSRRAQRARSVKILAGALTIAVLGLLNGPTLIASGEGLVHDFQINTEGYKRENGHWSVLSMPKHLRVNAVHAALLRTGKVLIIAGSGNNAKAFKAGTFKSLLWDPATNEFKQIATPSDMFCSGHAFLPDGKLLIAGGTRRYEVLPQDVKRAAGVMTIMNESPKGADHLAKGTTFVGPTGIRFRSTDDVVLPAADKTIDARGHVSVQASSTEVWVEAVVPGPSSVTTERQQFKAEGLKGARGHNVYGIADPLTRNIQDYWGDDKSYLFDPVTERYEKVSNLTLSRWYPTLVGLKDGKVLAVSGLDQFGRIIQGHNEIYDPATRRWSDQPQLDRTFPTYPSLFLMPSGDLFYSGSTTGYGKATVGRKPGIWNLDDNTFKVVPGLRDPDQTETSGSVLLPPAQDQRYMIMGGGGVGDSPRSTVRTDIADLTEAEPRFRPGPDLNKPTRYPNLVLTPDDKVLISGGSTGYRGAHNSDIFECNLYDPATNKLTRVADSSVGRNYHSEALLLPDGRVMTMGGDPLYADEADTVAGKFEQRIEIYSPPYLHRGSRPTIVGGPTEAGRGDAVRYITPDASKIKSARLIRPSAVTHVTDIEQRSIKLELTTTTGGFTVRIPAGAGLVPAGWYMLFADDAAGTPSAGRWVHIH